MDLSFVINVNRYKNYIRMIKMQGNFFKNLKRFFKIYTIEEVYAEVNEILAN
jgi:hypothetical protein